MGKKHKKHKSEQPLTEPEEEVPEKQPLKLVLKVGGKEPVEEEHEHKKHKHKKKKRKHKHHDHEHEKHHHHHHHEKQEKKRKREEIESLPSELPSQVESIEPPPKRHSPVEAPTIAKKSRHSRPSGADDDRTALQHCLDYLQRTLQRKDVNGFFGFPVTDQIAPHYSEIVPEAMDFSTMKLKIDNNEYKNVAEYKRDFRLMLDNCMTYNRPETIFCKAAQKLQNFGAKLMTKDKVLLMKRTLGGMGSLSNSEIGLDDDEDSKVMIVRVEGEEGSLKVQKVKSKKASARFEAFPDNLTPGEILAQARAAASEAADMLTLRKPNTKLGFLRRDKQGSTTFNFINPDNSGIVSETEKVVNLGSLCGKLSSGTGNIAGFREDKRNKAKAVSYLNYGPFSSYAPAFDSQFSNLTKEESDLLLSTYGDESAAQYAISLQSFVSDTSDYAVKLVDNMLDILSGNEHSKTKKVLEEFVQKRKKEEAKKTEVPEGSSKATEVNENKENNGLADIDVNSLRSLSNLGIDVSFLDEMNASTNENFQHKLDETSNLIAELQKTQHERLSQKPPSHLAYVKGPSQAESLLADKVTGHLTQMTRQVAPSDVISSNAIHKAIGLSVDAGEESQTEEQSDDCVVELVHDLQDLLPQEKMAESTVGDQGPS